MNHIVIILSFVLFAHTFLWGIRDPISAGELRRELEKIIDSCIPNPDDLEGNYTKRAYKKIEDTLSILKSLDDLNQSITENILSDIVGNIDAAIAFINLAILEPESESSSGDSDVMQQLQSDLEKLQDLQSRQDSLNEQIGKAGGRGQSGQANQDLASEQEGVRRDLDALRQQRYDRTGKLGDVANLDQAGTEMKEGAGDLRRDQPRQAQPHGDLAAEALGKAISQIEREMSQLAADMIDQLTSRAEQLGEGQGQLSGKTENAKGGQGEKLREEQESLNEGIEDLLEKIDRTGRSLGKFEERAMDDLLNLSRNARAGEIEKSGKRASNSLLYDAFPQAQKEQGKVEEELNSLQSGLQKLEDKLRYGESSALGELAEQLQRMSQEGEGMGDEQFRQANEEAANAVGSLPDADSDERLINLTRMFEESAIAEDIRNGRSMSAGAVEEASRLIEQFFWEKAAEQSLLRNHQSTQAPARYRKQVQEYFRRIAEGK